MRGWGARWGLLTHLHFWLISWDSPDPGAWPCLALHSGTMEGPLPFRASKGRSLQWTSHRRIPPAASSLLHSTACVEEPGWKMKCRSGLYIRAMEDWGAHSFSSLLLCGIFTCLLSVTWKVLNFGPWASPFNLRWSHSWVRFRLGAELISLPALWHLTFPDTLRRGLCPYPQIMALPAQSSALFLHSHCPQSSCMVPRYPDPAPALPIWSFCSKCSLGSYSPVRPEGAKQALPPGLWTCSFFFLHFFSSRGTCGFSLCFFLSLLKCHLS